MWQHMTTYEYNYCAVVAPAEAARIDPAILVVWPHSIFSEGVSLLFQGDKALIYRPTHVVICFRVLGNLESHDRDKALNFTISFSP